MVFLRKKSIILSFVLLFKEGRMLKAIYCFLCLVAILPKVVLAAPETGHVTQLNEAGFENFIQKAEKPVIVDFWATWCSPCMQMKPVFEQLANEYKEQYLFVSVNMDEGQAIAKKYGVASIPTFKVIQNNAVIGTFTGYMSKEAFIEQVENAIHKKSTLATLISAIQANDQELVAKCLANKDIDVNGISQINVMNMSMPMTPLMMAVSQFIFGQSSPEIISQLLKAGAQIDKEIELPELDSSMAVRKWNKTTVRLIAEEAAKESSQEELAALDSYTREKVLEGKVKASKVLALFKNSSAG
jgi:thioredoxin 1